MGSNQSQRLPPSEEETTTTIHIDRSVIPEAYSNVRVTRGVLHRVKSQHKPEERSQKASDVAQPSPAAVSSVPQQDEPPMTVSAENINEAKRVFRDTVDEVEKQYFNYHRENACADSEKVILDCLAKNTTQMLNCDSLWASYNQCISEFHAAVLREKSNSTQKVQPADGAGLVKRERHETIL